MGREARGAARHRGAPVPPPLRVEHDQPDTIELLVTDVGVDRDRGHRPLGGSPVIVRGPRAGERRLALEAQGHAIGVPQRVALDADVRQAVDRDVVEQPAVGDRHRLEGVHDAAEGFVAQLKRDRQHLIADIRSPDHHLRTPCREGDEESGGLWLPEVVRGFLGPQQGCLLDPAVQAEIEEKAAAEPDAVQSAVADESLDDRPTHPFPERRRGHRLRFQRAQQVHHGRPCRDARAQFR